MQNRDRLDIHNRTFLSIIYWPPGMDEELLAKRLAEVSRQDESVVKRRIKIAPPAIVGVLDQESASSAANVIIEMGGNALSPSLEDIQSLGGTMKIKDIHLGMDGICIDLWRGETRVIDPDNIDILIRTRLSEAHLVNPGDSAVGLITDNLNDSSGIGSAGWGFGGSYGLAAALHAFGDMFSGEHSGQLKLPTKLDIHTKDNQVFQVDAEKFGFQVLGDIRGERDNAKMDKMCEWITQLSPHCLIDPYFGYWKAPPGVDRLHLPLMRVNNEDPAFAFYSRWSALLYRHVMSAPLDN